ncbi:MAG TPA: DUF6666 family protein [Pirellulales bacterium]|nr:DUF6666 family protein [Pirellulales bacterium]
MNVRKPAATVIALLVVTLSSAPAGADGPVLNSNFDEVAPITPGGAAAPSAAFSATPYADLRSGAAAGLDLAPPDSAFDVKQVSHAESLCSRCDDGTCDECRAAYPDCGECAGASRLGFTAFSGTDTFRGPPEGSFQSNFGIVNGLNAAVPLVERWGLGWQLGASYGLYDFSGRSSSAPQLSGAQQQFFVTTGFFRRARAGQRASFGLVHDWMVNDNYGQFGLSPTLSQWRGQFEWAFSGRNSLGVWATIRDMSYIGDRPDNHNQFRAINQINLFWHHKFEQGADSWLYVGVPDAKRLVGGGLVGAVIVGSSAQVPLTDRLSLYANAMYMAANAHPGPIASTQDAYDVSVGMAWYPGRDARAKTVNGARWLPYMPLGNNGNFLVDASHFQ